jgi:taurine--2-oxoglutarate transaminase
MNYPFFFTWAKQNGADTFSFKTGKGPIIHTGEGKKVYDLSSLSFQAAFGMNHPHLQKKIQSQLKTLSVVSPKSVFPLKIRATERLLRYVEQKRNFEGKIFYTLSGAEGVENALKLARQVKKRKKILARKNSYHGATLGALSITGDWRNRAHFTVEDWTVWIPEPKEDPYCEKTREILIKNNPEDIAAFCLETVTGGNGVYPAPRSWWDGVKKLCLEFDLFLISDEVTCGFERTGKPFGFHHWGLKPDLVVMSKAITGGMIPFGALWVHPQIASRFEDEVLSLGLTNYAHPLGLAAMDGVLDLLEDEKFQKNLGELRKVFRRQLRKMEKLKVVREVRSIGLLAALDLHTPISWRDLFNRGLYLYSRPEMIILCPGYVYKPVELEKALDTLISVLKEK